MIAHSTPQRRFTLLDAMILVVAVAVGLGATRWFFRDLNLEDFAHRLTSNEPWSLELFKEAVSILMGLVSPVAMTTTLGVLALRFRPPRPRWRRLVRQPGLVACLVLAPMETFSMICSIASVMRNRSSLTGMPPTSIGLLEWLEPLSESASFLGGFGVAVAWSTQLLLGSWRPEPSTIDRLGRLVGLGSILMTLADLVVIRNRNF